MTNETWGHVREDLRKAVGANSYKAWIEPLRFKDLENRVARFYVPTTFMGNWVSRHYADKILQSLIENGLKADRIEFMLASEAANTAVAPAASAAAASAPNAPGSMTADHAAPTDAASRVAQADATRFSSASPGSGRRFNLAGGSDAGAEDGGSGGPLDARYTFDSFVVGKPNQLAHTAAYRIASGGPVTFNPLFLYGGVGLGKTHLMHAIAWHLQTHRPDLKVLYLSAEQFMYRFIRALRENGTMEFKSLFRSVDVLMVDDVQFIAGKDSTQEEFFHTFNALIDQNKQIVISADRAPGEIKKLEDRIASRLQCGLVVDLHPTDYELRLGILQTKLDQHLQHYPDVRIADGVLEFLAHRITTNIRVLEGALTRLFAFASLVGKTVTLDLTQDCLSDILRNSERKVTVEEIQRAVSEHYNIRLSDLVGPRRHRTVARPRQVAMWLSKQLTPRSLPEIGRRFGGRDHTTVMHAVKRIEELKGADSQIAEDLDLLRRTLEM